MIEDYQEKKKYAYGENAAKLAVDCGASKSRGAMNYRLGFEAHRAALSSGAWQELILEWWGDGS